MPPHRHLEDDGSLVRYVLPGRAAKVLVEGIERVRPQFAKYTAQLLLNPVNGVEEYAALHFELATTELPVRAKQEMKAE